MAATESPPASPVVGGVLDDGPEEKLKAQLAACLELGRSTLKLGGSGAGATSRLTLTELMATLTPAVLREVAKQVLPPSLAAFAKLYSDLKVGPRSVFLYQWLYRCTRLMALPQVLEEHRVAVTVAKSLINMLNVMLDDVGDEDRDLDLLTQLENEWGPMGDLAAVEASAGEDADDDAVLAAASGLEAGSREAKVYFCRALRRRVSSLLRGLPRFEQLARVLEYDLRQMINEKRYSAVCNSTPAMVNAVEHTMYAPHTMNAMIFLSIDLMACPPSVKHSELGLLRAVFWHANVMANKANCMATWPREVPKRDWSSPLFPLAVQKGVFTIADLESLPVPEIEARIAESGIEGDLLDGWYDEFDAVTELASRVTSIDCHEFNVQNAAFLIVHLSCRGHI